MTWKHTVVFGSLGAVLVALLTRVTFTVPMPDAPAPPAAGAATAAALASDVGRLRDRLRTSPRPLRSTRNPFAFGASPERAPHRDLAVPLAPTGGPVPATVAPARAPFTLIGLAEDSAADAPIRTAILSGPSGLFFVKAGDTIGAYRVLAVHSDSLELAGADGGSVRLVLTLE
ncbi:MAG: hypothetical protein AB7O32_12795 [Vicinamibacterales bacterium]